jgi:uncharacterized tellurite resistance protein B-like protein
MFNFIRETLLSNKGSIESGTDREERTRVAASVILLEAAQADHECSEEELAQVVETLKRDFDLKHEQAEELLEIAHRERNRAVDLFEFTNHINSEFSREEKQEVLESVWRIIYVDSILEKHEDYFVRKLTHLLRLSHTDMIQAKLKAKEQMQ